MKNYVKNIVHLQKKQNKWLRKKSENVNDEKENVIDVIKMKHRIDLQPQVISSYHIYFCFFVPTIFFLDADEEREEAAVKERYLGIVKVNKFLLILNLPIHLIQLLLEKTKSSSFK